MIVVDTSVLSLAFRRPAEREPHPAAAELRRLVEADEEVALPGLVLQEILSGVRDEAQFAALLASLEGFPVLRATADEHVLAARIRNRAIAAGIATSTVDALIAAQTISARGRLFTTDEDFLRLAPLCGLGLHGR
jgi:predicted nucleic acid-binding protein